MKEKVKPKVSIIILNWNGWRDTIECLESLYRINYPSYDVVVVDNCSTDDSIGKIKEYCLGKIKVNSRLVEYRADNKPIEVFEISEDSVESFLKGHYKNLAANSRVIIIKNKRNYGFAGGANIGINFALNILNPEYILLLNNDTVVDKDFLNELIKVAERNEKIGIVGPKIYYYDHFGRSDVISFIGEDIVPWKGVGQRYGCGEIDKGQWDRSMEPDKIEGSCMLIRREVFEKVGVFDEAFFCYYEEADFCLRAKRVGFKLKYSPNAKIWHKVASSTGGIASPIQIYFLTRNRLLFIMKNFPKEFWKHILYITFYEFWFKLGVYLLYYRDYKALRYYIKGLIEGYKTLLKYKAQDKSYKIVRDGNHDSKRS
jgi:GT2 family glycosyltransferase